MGWVDVRTDVLRHRVGKCPACKSYLWADVTVITEVNDPSIDADGKATVLAIAKEVGMTVEHTCWVGTDDETRPAARTNLTATTTDGTADEG